MCASRRANGYRPHLLALQIADCYQARSQLVTLTGVKEGLGSLSRCLPRVGLVEQGHARLPISASRVHYRHNQQRPPIHRHRCCRLLARAAGITLIADGMSRQLVTWRARIEVYCDGATQGAKRQNLPAAGGIRVVPETRTQPRHPP